MVEPDGDLNRCKGQLERGHREIFLPGSGPSWTPTRQQRRFWQADNPISEFGLVYALIGWTIFLVGRRSAGSQDRSTCRSCSHPAGTTWQVTNPALLWVRLEPRKAELYMKRVWWDGLHTLALFQCDVQCDQLDAWFESRSGSSWGPFPHCLIILKPTWLPGFGNTIDYSRRPFRCPIWSAGNTSTHAEENICLGDLAYVLIWSYDRIDRASD